jgi:hypothetical protein
VSNKLDIELKQGEDFYRLLTIKDENGTPINLTGFSFASQIRSSYSDELFLSFSFNIKDQGTNPGEVEWRLSSALSSAKEVNTKLRYVYDVEMNSGTIKTRIMEGVCLVTPEVTR